MRVKMAFNYEKIRTFILEFQTFQLNDWRFI